MEKINIENASILITGAAGFIGYHLTKSLFSYKGVKIIGIDNLNSYYDPAIKEARVQDLKERAKNFPSVSFNFYKVDISDNKALTPIFTSNKFDIVVNLAAQAGVRYSIENPRVYVESNVLGFFNILELVRNSGVKHLVFASSSSVYGNNKKTPYSTTDKVDNPISLYAATKKSNELFAYTYSHLYNIRTTGLRFFTVYGPFGRPDMAYYKWTNMAVKGKTIPVYNNGNLFRDFTYISDIVEGIINVIKTPPLLQEEAYYKIYNIGNSKTESLSHFIEVLETSLQEAGVIKEKFNKEYLPMQAGDVYKTYADTSDLEQDLGYKPSTPIEKGLKEFALWYKEYYKIK